MPDTPVTNFTTDWNNGTALGNLMQALYPGVFYGLETPSDSLELIVLCLKRGWVVMSCKCIDNEMHSL